MVKEKYENWTKDELIKEVKKLRKRKKYGIVWEDKPEKVAELCKEKLPVLEEDKTKEIKTDDKKPVNILIEGDNYHSLSVLNYTHKGKIDVIYIDPPYNTGAKDWKYNNNYVDGEDSFRHSKWLSFMKKRLKLAKRLLKRNGVLICAIDDNELCSLGLLLDEIFHDKIRNTLVIATNPHGVSRSGFSRTHEYAYFIINKGFKVNKKKVPEDVREINLRRSGNNSLRTDSPTMFYPIFVGKKTRTIVGVGQVPDKNFHPKKQNIEKDEYFEIWPLDSNGIEKNWYYSLKRVKNRWNEELFTKTVKDQINIYFHHSNKGEQTYKSVWTGSQYDAGAYGATVVKRITNNNFPFPKSVNTVSDCLKSVLKSKDAIVLDYFAGSGTTGHVVMNLNKEDGGNRKFILCTNNENHICEEVTYPRIKNIIRGYNSTKGIKSNLKYFKTDFVDAKTTDINKRRLVDKSTEMLCLKEDCFDFVKKGKDFQVFKGKNGELLGIVYDDDGIELFKKEVKKINDKFIVYVFSLDESAREEEFEDISDLVTLKPIPAVILNVYNRIFR